MRRIVAVTLVVALVGPSASAGGKRKPITWSEAQNLQSPTWIRLAVRGRPPVRVQLWYVDEATLVTSTPAEPLNLPRQAKDTLSQMGANWAAVVKGGEYQSGSIRVSPDGVFDGTARVADLKSIVQFTPRDHVAAIEVEPPPSHTARNTIVIVVGVLIVLAILLVPAMSNRTNS